MNIHTIHDGPIISAIASYSPAINVPYFLRTADENMSSLISCPNFWNLDHELPLADKPISLSREFLRSSGIKRPMSAARSSVYAAIVAKALLEVVPEHEVRLTGVIVMTTSAALAIAQRFEVSGLTEGWELVDPFLLPNSLPSAVATHVASLIGAQAFAVSMMDGASSFYSASEYALLMLGTRAQHVLILATEETCPSMASLAEKSAPSLREGCLGILVSDARLHKFGWRLTDLREEPHLPREKLDPLTSPTSIPDDQTLFQSLSPLIELFKLLSSATEKITVSAGTKGRGRFLVTWKLDNRH
jgi:hypothetical protein